MRYLARLSAAFAIAAASLFPFAVESQTASDSAKALVYCPVGIDVVGCTNISAALAASFPGGVDLAYDGSGGTIDLRSGDLWRYEVFVVPSLADGAGTMPYALLRDAVVAERLRDALMGRLAMWSGTPDLGSASSPNRDQKNALIVNLARWAAANHAVVKGPGLVTFLDQSEAATERYDWVRAITGINVIADLKITSYAAVSAITPTATSILANGDALFAYTNMASFGFQIPSGAAGVSLDAIGSTGTDVGGQVVLLTSRGGNTADAIVKTDLDDYAPGTTVVMSGSGWQPGETVTLTLHEDPAAHADRSFTTIADASGSFEFTGFAPEEHDIDVRFILTATGASSGFRAQTTFTDGITFAGSTTADNGAGATSLTIGAPPGTVAGDVLLAQVTFYGGSLVATPPTPTGWVLVNRDNSGTNIGQAIYSKIAIASEPAQYTWSFANTARKAAGGIVRYSGADVVTDGNPVAAWALKSGTAPAGTVTSLVAPSVATKTRSSMVVTFFAHRDNVSLSTPALMTQRHQRANPSTATPPGPSIMASEIEQYDVAETGEYTSTANASAAWVAHTIVLDWRQHTTGVLNPAGRELTLAQAGDVTPGDLLLASIAFRNDNAVNITAPAGWQLIAKQTGTGTPLGHATYWKVADARGTQSFKWTFSLDTRAVGGITAYADMDVDAGAAVIDAWAADQNVNGSINPAAPTVTTTAPGDVLAALYAIDANVTITPPSGMLLRYHIGASGTTRAIVVDGLQSSAGPSGTKVLTTTTVENTTPPTPASVRWFAQTVAMRRRPLPAKLVFTTPATSGLVNACLGPVSVQTSDDHDRPAKVMTSLAVNLVTSGTGQFFSSAGCSTTAVTSVTLAAGTSSATVWYKPLVLGTGIHQVSAAAAGIVGASQSQTIAADPTAPAPVNVIANLVRTTATSAYNPPSPDPSGLAFAAHLGNLVMVDGEVDEMPIFGANVFEVTPGNGVPVRWATITSYTSEPTGVAYNSSNRHLFVSDDDKKKIFEIDYGPDGQYFTADDRVTSFETSPFGSNDPEGLAFDTDEGVLFIADGVASQVYRVSPGVNGVFDGVAPVGDDQVTNFDTEVHGLRDPEGIAYDSDLRHLYVVGSPRNRVFRISTAGVLLGTVDITSSGAVNPAGLEYIPSSAGVGASGLFLVARGVDNDTDPNENDGKLYQFLVPSSAPNNPPVVTITGPGNGSAYTQGSVITFTGTATDPEDGDLAGAMTWSSSLNGPLGTGPSVSASSLSVGTHTITVSVTDSRSAQTSATVTVTVNKLIVPTTVSGITASTSTFGGTTTLSATVSPAAVGSVAFFLGGSLTPIGATYDAATGLATLSNHAHGLDANPGGYDVRAVFTPANGDYLGSQATSSNALQVAQATQTIAFDLSGVTATYGDGPVSIAASGGASGNPVTFATETPATCDLSGASQVRILMAGSCTITASQAGTTNYAAALPVTRSVAIAARALAITATGTDKVYDGTTAATVALSDDRLAGDELSVTYTAATFSDANVGSTKPITVSGLAVTGAAAGNYALAAPTATAVAGITPRALTVSAAGSSRTYDGTTAAIVTLSDDRLVGDALTASYGSATFADRHAGDNKTISVTGIVISGGDAANYTANAAATTSGSITPRALTVTASGTDKVYDGGSAAAVTLADDRLPDDALEVGYASASFADADVGTGKAITIQGITLSGADARDYTANGTATASASIAALAVSGAIAAADKTYDGTTAAVATAQPLAGLIAGDAVALLVANARFDSKDVGARTVTAEISLGGTASRNYVLATPSATASANIGAKALVGSFSAASRVYDGTTAATVTATSLAGVEASDAVTLQAANAAFDSRNAGSAKPVTASLALAGADAFNYTVNATAVSAADISPRSLVVSATGVDKVYDGTPGADVVLADDRIPGDVLTAAYGAAAFADANAGVGKPIAVSGISITGGDAGNYIANATASAIASIAARPIAVVAEAAAKVYGDADPTLAYSVASGSLVAGDVFSGALGRTAGERVAGSPYVIGQGTLTAGPNYQLGFTGAAFTITRRPVAAKISASDKVYDGTASATIVVTLDGTIAEDQVGATAGPGTFADKRAGSDKQVTAAGITLSGSDADNYLLASATAATTADITPRALTVSATAEDKVYDGTIAATVMLSDDRVAGDVLTADHAGATFADANAGANKPVAITGISITGLDAANYVANTTASAVASITTRAIAVRANPTTKVYGDVDPTLTYELTGTLVAGETLTGELARAAGETVAEGPYAIQQGTLSAGPNYQLAFSGASLTVTPRLVTPVVSAANKVYDGNASATIASSTLQGTIATDAVGLGVAAASFADRNVGNDKTVTAQGLVLTGADAGNYSLGAVTATTTASISPRPLALAAAAENKVYDGSTGARVTLSDDRLSGDALDVTFTAAAFADANVGTKPVTVSGIVIGGADAANYVASSTVSTTASILARAIAVAAHAKTKVYGDADPELTYDVTAGSLVTGETLAGSLSRAAGESVAGGPYAIGQGTLSAGSNYELTFSGANLTVTPRAVTAAVVASSKIYDGNTSAQVSSGTVNGALASDAVGLGFGPATFSDRNVASGKLVTVSGLALTGAAAGNYSLGSSTATTTADITARPLAITASAQDKVYDGGVAAVVTLTDNRVDGDALETAFASASFADKHVGAGKTVTVSGISLGGADAGNYLASSVVNTTATIERRSVTATIVASDKVYDGTTAAVTVVSLDGAVANDAVTVSGGPGSFADKNVGTGKQVSAAGITLAGADAGNYQLASPEAVTTASITPRALTISATGRDKQYDGTTAAVVTLGDNHLAGDAVDVAYGVASFADANVGTAKAITVSGISVTGADAANYSFDAAALLNASGSITPRPIAVTAHAKSKVYGEADPAFTYSTVSGSLVSGDAFTGGLGRTAGETVAASPYAIGQGDFTAGPNYQLTFTGADLTITPRPVTATVVAGDKVYDGTTTADVVATLSGAIAGDDVAVVEGSASFLDKHVGTGKQVTVSGLALARSAAGNYVLTSSTATTTANITTRTLAISVTATSKVYDGTTAATVTLSDDRLSGDALTTSYVAASFADPNAGSSKLVTVTGIAIDGADAGNYSVDPTASATADITPASATITLGNLSQRWDGTVKSATATTSPAALGVTLTYSQNGVPVAEPRNAGFYDVVATISDPNHQGRATGTLVILNLIDVIPSNSMNIIKISDTKTTEIMTAVLGTASFDARTVAPASVTLGDGIGTDAPVNTSSTGALRTTIADVNYDGRPDLVLYFRKTTVMAEGSVTTSTTALVMRGKLTTGAQFMGTDKVVVYP